jgi:putative ABC transport system permease protein
VNGVYTGEHALPTLTVADAVAIKNQVPLIKRVSPNIDDPIQVIYGNVNWYTTYHGVAPEYLAIRRWFVDQGAFFTDEDVERSADVCVLGRSVRDRLFGGEDPTAKSFALAPACAARSSGQCSQKGCRYLDRIRTTRSCCRTPPGRRS